MNEAIRFYLAAQVIAAASLPLCLLLFQRLPERGYGLSKPFGLVLAAALYWYALHVHALRNHGASVVVVALVLAAVSVWVVRRRALTFRGWLAESWRVWLFEEVVFLLAFVIAAYLRSFTPEIANTEKPFEYAVLNSVVHSRYYPPLDPWYAGHSLSYYYFGYVVFALPIRLAAVSTAYGFNLSLALTAALISVAIFSVAFNLCALVRRSTLRDPAVPAIVGLLAVVLAIVMGNAESVFELMAVHHVGPHGLYGLLNVEGLKGYQQATQWWPTGFWFWWRSTRLSSNWNIFEYPSFSFLLGDLHPHTLVVPTTLTLLSLWLVLLLERASPTLRWLRQHVWWALAAGVGTGLVSATNSWDFPTQALWLAVALGALWWWSGGGRRELLQAAGVFVVLLLVGAIAASPYYLTLQARTGLIPVEVAHRPSWLPPSALSTRPSDFLLQWTPLLVCSVGWLAWRAKVLARAETASRDLIVALAPAMVLYGSWALLLTLTRGIGGLGDEFRARGAAMFTMAGMAAWLTLATYVFVREVQERDSTGRIFLALAASVAAFLIMAPEFYYVYDIVPSRHNTVFKFGYQAWFLLALVSAVGLWDTWHAVRARAAALAPRLAWGAAAFVAVGAGLVFPVIGVANRSNGLKNPQTLNGLAYVQQQDPSQYALLQWLAKNVKPGTVVLEGVADDYTDGGRVSARTGLPTLVGWRNHEWQERGGLGPVQRRVDDVRTIYDTTDPGAALTLMRKFDVSYVVVGGLERRTYSAAGLTKFASMGRVVFQQGDVTLYRVIGTGTAPARALP